MSTIGGRGGCSFNIFNSGVVQSVIVFLCATAFNLPRWYEYEFKYRYVNQNVVWEITNRLGGEGRGWGQVL